MLKEFHEIDRSTIKDRGLCIAVKNPGGFVDGELMGTNVLIDGDLYSVHGVETFAIGRPYPDNLDFALLVEPLDWVDQTAEPNGIGPVCRFCHLLIDSHPDDHEPDCQAR